MDAIIPSNATRIEKLEAEIEKMTEERDQLTRDVKSAIDQRNVATIIIGIISTVIVLLFIGIALNSPLQKENSIDQFTKIKAGQTYQILPSPFLHDKENGFYKAFAKTPDGKPEVIELPEIPPSNNFFVLQNEDGELEMQPLAPSADEVAKNSNRLAWLEHTNWIRTMKDAGKLETEVLQLDELVRFSDSFSIQYNGIEESENQTHPRLKFIIVHDSKAFHVKLPAFKELKTGTIFGTIALKHQGIPLNLIIIEAAQDQIELAIEDPKNTESPQPAL